MKRKSHKIAKQSETKQDMFCAQLDCGPEPNEKSITCLPSENAPYASESQVNSGQENMAEAKDFAGELNIRIPKSLHLQLSKQAKSEGVALPEYIIYKLTQQ